MTTEIQQVEQTPAQELADAQAAFATVSDAAPAEAAVTATPVVEPAVEAPVVKEVAKDPWEGVAPILRTTIESINGKLGGIDKLSTSLRETAGRVGAIQSELAAGKAAAKTVAAAPTDAQITAAVSDGAKMKKMREDFPDWAEATDEQFAAIRAELLAKIPQSQTVDVDAIKRDVREGLNKEIVKSTTEAVDRARNLGRIDSKYPDWETDGTIYAPGTRKLTPEFAAWQQTQPPEIRALGDSDRAGDAIKMLDLYYDHRKTEATRQKQQQRLETAIPVRGTGGPRQPTTNDRAEAEKAFAAQ